MAKDDELKQLQDDIKRMLDEPSNHDFFEKPNSSLREDEPVKMDPGEEMPDSGMDPGEEMPDSGIDPGEEMPDSGIDPGEEMPDSGIDLEEIGGFRVLDVDPDEPELSEEPDAIEQPDEDKKKKSKMWNRILFAVGILMIVYAAYSLGSLYWNYHTSNQEYDDIAREFVTVNQNDTDDDDYDGMVTVNSENSDSTNPWYNEISVDLAGLQSRYPDVAGWLYQEGATAISYPIMYNEDDVYYLHKTYKGTYAYAGSIFMETLNDRDFSDSNTIIYGHNMRNGSMFGTLKYLSNDGYIDTHGYFQIFLEDEIRRYQVFAFEVVSYDSWVYQVPFGETEAFTEYINKAIANSEVDTGVEVTNQDQIIVLSTCYGGTNTTKRFVVFAVWMDTYYYDSGLTQSEIEASGAEDTSSAVTGSEAESE